MTANNSARSLLNPSRHAMALSSLLAIGLLAAPSLASAGLPPALDHFRVYPNEPGTGQDGPVVQIADQFALQVTDLGPPIRFMVPVNKNDEGLSDFFSHLTCYQIVDGAAGPAVISTNQFGVQPLTLGAPDSLCVPTEKLISPGPVSIDHYKCYLASGAPVEVAVSLQDQFDQGNPTLLEPRLFCTPADKNSELAVDPVTHLTCYDTTPPGAAPGGVPILNQFVPEADQLELLEANMLCAPSTKQLPTPLEHFTVYRATGPGGPRVTIADQFGIQATDLGLTSLFMVPAEKNSEPLLDPNTHLTCYDIDDPVLPPNFQVTVTNQFGNDQPFKVGVPKELCVPTEKLIDPGPIDGDHYRCWEASDPSGGSFALSVELTDQFQNFSANIMVPFRLCAPADKDGEGIQDVDSHLACYLFDQPTNSLGLQVPINNQFFMDLDINVDEAFALCVPSLKTVPEPGVLLALGSGLALLAAFDRRRRRP